MFYGIKKMLIWILCFSLMLSNVSVTALASNSDLMIEDSANDVTLEATALEKEIEIVSKETVSANEGVEEPDETDTTVNGEQALETEGIDSNQLENLEGSSEAVTTDAEGNDIASGTVENKKGGIIWCIDATGQLIVSGKGEIPDGNAETSHIKEMPWHGYADQVKSAKVNLSEIEDLSFLLAECWDMTQVASSFLQQKML